MTYQGIKRRIAFYTFLSNTGSVILHPLLMPLITFALIFYFCPVAVELNPDAIRKLLMTIFVITFVFPFLSTFVLIYVAKRNFSINHLYMEDHRERFYPFMFTGFFYIAITFIFIREHFPLVIVAIMGGIALITLVTSIITFFWKISVHAIGICGVLGFMLVVSFYYPYELMLYPVGGVALLAGFLLSARLYLNAHSPKEVFWGGFVGLILSIASFVFIKRYGIIFY